MKPILATIYCTYHEPVCTIGNSIIHKDVAISLIIKVAFPQISGLIHKVILEIHIPVLILIVELAVLMGGHTAHVDNAVVLLHAHIFYRGDGIRG